MSTKACATAASLKSELEERRRVYRYVATAVVNDP